METSRIQQLNRLLDLSGQMLVAVQREEWEELEALEAERQKLLPDFSSSSLSEEQVDQVREVVEDILHINQLMVDLSESRQNEYRQSNRKFAVAQKAVSAYGDA